MTNFNSNESDKAMSTPDLPTVDAPVVEELPYEIAVHVGHCCGRHGCKYTKTDCPVLSGQYEQKYGCPWCESTKSLDQQVADLTEEREWSAKLEARGLHLHAEY